ncbi:winged helix-turn-helix transcriptional regulator [Pseudokineococcus sp. 1T1Z-3]|uniref:winged helix-turn-helix transcriptional regulator n=1 Tax=Pseudokineococcus sp. 1T1Z-3 TaxID=3132745 RepID=UPI0030B20156
MPAGPADGPDHRGSQDGPDMLSAGCPTRQVLDRVAGRWTMLVLLALEEGPRGFSALQRRVEGVSHKVLTQTLRALERDGLVDREVFATTPVTVEYRLTVLGTELSGVVDGIREWAYARIDVVEAARARYDERPRRPGPVTPVTPVHGDLRARPPRRTGGSAGAGGGTSPG